MRKQWLALIVVLTMLMSCNTTENGDDKMDDNTANNSAPPIVEVDTATLFRYDGYANYQSLEPVLSDAADTLTLFYSIAPASWESVNTGIVSELSINDNAGYDLSTGKYRSIVFRYGDGKQIVEVRTGFNVINRDEWNTVQVDFRGDLGEVTIKVNGETAQTHQMESGTQIMPAKVERRIGCNYDGDIVGGGVMRRNVFDGYIIEENATGAVVFEPKRNLVGEMNHPAVHASPPENWMNEPHGPIYYNGVYHLFYQSNPHGPYFNNLNWGHWVSDDMVNWRNLPVAIEPEYGTVSPDGCWSGSSAYAADGTPLIFYTAGDDTKSPNQMVAIARPDDLSDPDITHWTPDDKVIITQQKDVMAAGEFRDPFVYQQDGKTWCFVGTGDKSTGAGNAGVYLATDDTLDNWEYTGFLMDYDYIPDIGRVWELPVLLPISGGDADTTHILTVCACRVENGAPVKTYYWLGRFDTEQGKFIPNDITPRAIDENALSIGGTGFVTPDGRSVLFLIAQGRRSSDADGAAGYAHCASIPLDLWIEDGELRIKPIDETEGLRRQTVASVQNVDKTEANAVLSDIQNDVFEVVMELPNQDFTVLIGQKTLAYYKESSDFGFRADGYSGGAQTVSIDGDTVTLRIIVDRSLVECFLDEQSYCATRVYVKENQKRQVSIICDNAIKSITIYTLAS